MEESVSNVCVELGTYILLLQGLELKLSCCSRCLELKRTMDLPSVAVDTVAVAVVAAAASNNHQLLITNRNENRIIPN